MPIRPPYANADASWFQAHVDSGELGGHRQLAHRNLARPATGKQTIARGCEGEFEVGDRAGIRVGGSQQVGIFAFQGYIAGPRIEAPRSPRIGCGSVSDCGAIGAMIAHPLLSPLSRCLFGALLMMKFSQAV